MNHRPGSFAEQMFKTLVLAMSHLPLPILVGNWHYCNEQSNDYLNKSIMQRVCLDDKKEALAYLIRSRLSPV